MFRPLPYALLLIFVVLLQVFIFDRLMISAHILPLVYIAFILLLPMQMTQSQMLMWGLGIGLLFDVLMGVAGLNTIATVFVSFIRIYLLTMVVGTNLVVMGGVPTIARIGLRRFVYYLPLMVLIHGVIFFSLEFLNFDALSFLVRRILYSCAVTTLFVWLVAGRFEQVLLRKS